MKKPYPAMITWRDHWHSADSQVELRDVHAFKDEFIVTSVGWVIAENDKVVHMALDLNEGPDGKWTDENKDAKHIIHILKNCIKKKKRLK